MQGLRAITHRPMVLYHAADLLWSTRIRAEAEAAGIPARPVRSVEMLRARLLDSPVRGLITDLDDPEVALDLIRHLRGPGGGAPGVRIAAFGPHVATALLAAAKEAGADAVLARGAFSRRITEVLVALDRSEPLADDAQE